MILSPIIFNILFCVASGLIIAGVPYFFHSPVLICSTGPSYINHCPSFVMPIGIMYYFSSFIFEIIIEAELRETSCSGDCPPNITTIFFLFIYYRYCKLINKEIKSIYSVFYFIIMLLVLQ